MSTAVEVIKSQLEAKRQEKRRLEEALYRVQGYIAALESSLEIVGSSRKTSRHIAATDSVSVNVLDGVRSVLGSFKRQPKLHDLAYSVLKKAGHPLTGPEVVSLMRAEGSHSSKESIVGAIYRAAKEGDRFVASRGIFALREWQSEKDEKVWTSELKKELEEK